MLGVNEMLASNIGLEAIWSLHDSGLSKTHTRRSGQDESLRGLILANGQGRTTNDSSSEDDI